MRFEGRRSIRLRGYDYSREGAYFVTICTQNRACLFGEIANGEMRLNQPGRMIHQHWADITARFPTVELGCFVVMPNHLHGIILLDASHPDDPASVAHPSLAAIVHWFKTGTTYDYVEGVKNRCWTPFDRRLWQRNYYEHIIRSDHALKRIQSYIEANPSLWNEDALHPATPVFCARGTR